MRIHIITKSDCHAKSTRSRMIILTMLLILSNMVRAQFEFEYIFDSIKNESSCSLFSDIIELDNGDFIVNGRDLANYYTQCIYKFSASGNLIKEKHFKDELKMPGYKQYDDEGSPLLVDKNGGYYMFLTYNPIFDTANINYVPGTFDAKIMMNKLNDDFEIEYSKEMSIGLDTVDWESLWAHYNSVFIPPFITIGTVIDDNGEGFVISYEKYIGEHPKHLWEHGNDSTFFLKTDYNLNVNTEGYYEHNRCNNKRHKNHLLHDNEENKYIYYTGSDWRENDATKKGFYIHVFDEDFHFVKESMLPNSDGLGYNTYRFRDNTSTCEGITLRRTSSHTTIIGGGTEIFNATNNTIEDYFAATCIEINDDAVLLDSMNFAHSDGDSPNYRTGVPSGCSIDFIDENRLFFGATPGAYYSYMLMPAVYQFFILRLLDRNLNTLDEVYYNAGVDSTVLWTNTLKATSDGGCIIAGLYRNYVENPNTIIPRACHSVLKKFPPEAFDGIEEAHANGLKVAFAYPNPGNAQLNIRTSLSDASVEVYDSQGKLIHYQSITDIITPISTDTWPSGIYFWRVLSGISTGVVTVAETGKWIKE